MDEKFPVMWNSNNAAGSGDWEHWYDLPIRESHRKYCIVELAYEFYVYDAPRVYPVENGRTKGATGVGGRKQ